MPGTGIVGTPPPPGNANVFVPGSFIAPECIGYRGGEELEG
jgi:hypothetical protein